MDLKALELQEKNLLESLRISNERLVQLQEIRETLGGQLEIYTRYLAFYCKRVNHAMDEGIRAEAGSVETEILFPERVGIEGTELQMAKQSIDSEIEKVHCEITDAQSERARLCDCIAEAKRQMLEKEH